MTRFTLCIDPGTAHTGWAVFRETTLVGCGHTSFKKILAGLQQFLPPFVDAPRPPLQLVIEVPKKYQHEEHPVGDLITLAFRAGVIAGIQRVPDLVVYNPAEWKGSVPKPVHHRRIRSVLSADEEALLKHTKSARSKAESPDMLDAIGLGLFHLKRTGRGGARFGPGAQDELPRVGRAEDQAGEADED